MIRRPERGRALQVIEKWPATETVRILRVT
jgi:hypothetical protein